jgi:hypothetical protein
MEDPFICTTTHAATTGAATNHGSQLRAFTTPMARCRRLLPVHEGVGLEEFPYNTNGGAVPIYDEVRMRHATEEKRRAATRLFVPRKIPT